MNRRTSISKNKERLFNRFAKLMLRACYKLEDGADLIGFTSWYPSKRWEDVLEIYKLPKIGESNGWLYGAEAQKTMIVIRDQYKKEQLMYWLKENGIEDWAGIIGRLKE